MKCNLYPAVSAICNRKAPVLMVPVRPIFPFVLVVGCHSSTVDITILCKVLPKYCTTTACSVARFLLRVFHAV